MIRAEPDWRRNRPWLGRTWCRYWRRRSLQSAAAVFEASGALRHSRFGKPWRRTAAASANSHRAIMLRSSIPRLPAASRGTPYVHAERAAMVLPFVARTVHCVRVDSSRCGSVARRADRVISRSQRNVR